MVHKISKAKGKHKPQEDMPALAAMVTKPMAGEGRGMYVVVMDQLECLAASKHTQEYMKILFAMAVVSIGGVQCMLRLSSWD